MCRPAFLHVVYVQAAGKTGRVVDVDDNGDVKVKVAGKVWIFNPQCCILESSPVTGDQSEDSNSSQSDDDSDNDSNENANSKLTRSNVEPTFTDAPPLMFQHSLQRCWSTTDKCPLHFP